MPNEPADDLIRDLGELIAAREAMRIGNEATRKALDKAMLDAGLAVSRTIGGSDPAKVGAARELIAECRNLIAVLRVELARSRDAIAESSKLSRHGADVLTDIRSLREEIDRRRREKR